MANTYTVEILHQGTTHTLTVPEDQTILSVADAAGLEFPSACNAGVCTTCAAQVMSGTVDQSEGMGLSPHLQTQGYALLCVSYPRSDLKIETEKEDRVYYLQYGQFQKVKK
jgi:ferredoxin